MPKLDAQGLLEMAQQAVTLFTTLHKTYAEIKDTLSADEQTELNDKLRSIHTENVALSAELDAALRDAERR